MIKNLFKLLNVIAVIAIGIASYAVCDRLSVVQIGNLYNSVISIAAIIFGVLGAWVGLLKNQIETSIKDPTISRKERQSHVDRMSSLIKPLSLACLIVCICIIYNFMAGVVPYIEYYKNFSTEIKCTAIFIFGVVSYFQTISILNIAITGIDTYLEIKYLAEEVSEQSQR